MRQFVYKFLTAGIVHEDLTVLRSYIMTNAILFITSSICLLALFLNLKIFNAPALATLDAIAFIVSLGAMVDLRFNRVLERAINIGTANLFFLLIAFAYTNQSNEYGLIWTIFFPIFAITLMGYKKGFVVISVFYLVLFSMAYNAIGVWDGGQWSLKAFTRLAITLGILTYVIYVYEAVLRHSNIKLQLIRNKEAEHLEELRELNEHLERRVEQEVASKLELLRQRDIERDALIQNEKMAQLGDMMGTLLHQWSQPLSTISAHAQSLDLEASFNMLSPTVAHETSRSILNQVDFMVETANNFRDFYKPTKSKEQFNIFKQLQSVISLLHKQLTLASIRFEINGDQNVFGFGYTSEFKQVLLNIINNAKDALLEQKTKNPSILINIDLKDNSKVLITIKDNAGGIPEELLPNKLFEQFVSTKGNEGTGVGLSLSKTIIEERMGGTLTASNTTNGAVFAIELPRA